MKETLCADCRGPRPSYSCGICQELVCKGCVRFSDEQALAYLPSVPPDLVHPTYCNSCHAQKVEPELRGIQETLQKAHGIAVFFKNEGKKTRLIMRKQKPFVVEGCADKQEAMMKLAFLTAKSGFNSMVDVDVSFVKTKTNFYQTSIWKGSAVPVNLNQVQLDRE